MRKSWWIGAATVAFAALSAYAKDEPEARASGPAGGATPLSHVVSIVSHEVRAEVDGSGVAHVTVDMTMRSTSAREEEFELLFPAPDGAILDSFVLTSADKPMTGKAYPAAEARAMYEDIVRRRRDPALLEYAGRALFRAKVFPVPANGEMRVRLSYKDVLKATSGLYELHYLLGANTFEVRFGGPSKPTTIYSPTHVLAIDGAVARYQPTVAGEAPRPLVLFFGSADTPIDGRVICYRPPGATHGYFMLLLSPNVPADATDTGKNVILVFDRSGSMAGKKIEQAREAIRFVLSSLGEADLFNVIVYNDQVQSFKSGLVEYVPALRDEAIRFATSPPAESGTNIHDSLVTALSQLPENGRPNFVIFVTDGLPTVGVTDHGAIWQAAKAANKRNARLMVFGVGHDVNGVLLDRLAVENKGLAEYVRPEESIEQKISELYSSIKHPVLTDVGLEFECNPVTDVYPRELSDIFRGRPLVVVGRYKVNDWPPVVRLKGKSGGTEKTFVYNFLDTGAESPQREFIARVWATRRVAYLVDEVRLHGVNDELVNEITRLGTQFGILTEYTAFLAEDGVDLTAFAANALRCKKELEGRTSEESGSHGFAQAANTKERQQTGQVEYKNAWLDANGQMIEVGGVRQVGAKTFYRRAKGWVDAECASAKEEVLKNAIEVRAFSDAYFELLRTAGIDTQYLAVGTDATLVLNGKVYRITSEETAAAPPAPAATPSSN